MTHTEAPPEPGSWQDIAEQRERALKEALARENHVYRERAHLIALLAALYPRGTSIGCTDPNEPEWPVVTVCIPEGQLTWHVDPRDVDLFQHVPHADAKWDGHDTEEKYRRITAMTARVAANGGVDQ